MRRRIHVIANLLLKVSVFKALRILISVYLFREQSRFRILGMQIIFEKGFRDYFTQIINEVFIQRAYELSAKSAELLRSSSIQRNLTIIDAGANIGIATCYFRAEFPKAKLIAIEPSPINFSWLSKNIAENNLREVTLVHGYLSRESGRVNFNHNVEKPGSSFGSDNRSKTSRQLVETEVDSLRLSEVIANLNLVVIKIDVEGGEYDLLDDLIESKNIGNILEIVAEVTTIRPEDYSRLNKCILNFMREGFKPLLRSDSTLLQAKDSKQNHLLLHLINTNWILPDAFQLKKEVY